jgi:hypothetical protein
MGRYGFQPELASPVLKTILKSGFRTRGGIGPGHASRAIHLPTPLKNSEELTVLDRALRFGGAIIKIFY